MKRSTTAKAAATILTASALVAGIGVAIQPMFTATATVEAPTDTPTVGTPTDTAEPTIEEQIAQCEAMLNAKHPDSAGTCDTIGIPPAAGDDVLMPPVNSYEEAYSQCIQYFTGQDMVDCIGAAMAAWMGTYEPEAAPEDEQPTPEEEQAMQDDAMAQEQEQIDADMAELAEPLEDEPGFDCRYHGNQICYVTIGDGEYAVSFHDGYSDLVWDVLN